MNRKPVVLTRNSDGRFGIDVPSVPDWEGFEKLARFLENEYQAQVINKADGPDSRQWILLVGGHEVILRHDDPYGNTIESKDALGAKIVEAIGKDLEARLKGF
ncbi:hypothetical protein CAI21_22270 [Alkalilimnicola ehrlichii]|uniref:Uncharacterized protein n=1 Tax=Alkalilimnicola ehrlichii TaxID=351052 RepID=A0A3E0WEY2_9GAMM|nr:DUF3630 family protein [Alkalilimnicola ehrlichii]RFA24283.1 hypothetical protein CAI21_22270 [Alkalilimnicola ehrlichii]RFA31512.1 hypothetical protein CAL65_22485 [Alkalilimnicola ehrlichii]